MDLNDLVSLLGLFELWLAYRAFNTSTLKCKRKSPAAWMYDYFTKRSYHSQTVILMPLLRDHLALAGQQKLIKSTWGVDVQMFDNILSRVGLLIQRPTQSTGNVSVLTTNLR